jgi:hypothetical protein
VSSRRIDLLRLEVEVLERRIEHDDVATELALLLPETSGTASAAAATKRAHLDRVAQWLDQIVEHRRDLLTVAVPLAEVGRSNPSRALADQMELQRALLRVQDVRMELAELSKAPEKR